MSVSVQQDQMILKMHKSVVKVNAIGHNYRF